MNVIFVLIALSLCVALGFLAAFLWAVRSGQYDDTHTPAMRMLFEDRQRSSVDGQRMKQTSRRGRRTTDDR